MKGVHNPKDYDAVALLVPHNANRKVIPPQKMQWMIKGSSGAGYLKSGSGSVTCALLSSNLRLHGQNRRLVA